jgi:hypothetical protein
MANSASVTRRVVENIEHIAFRLGAGTPLRCLVTGFGVSAASNNRRTPCSNCSTAFLGELLRLVPCIGAETSLAACEPVLDAVAASQISASCPPWVDLRAACVGAAGYGASCCVHPLAAGDSSPRRIDGSRMSREVPVRFCEGLGLQCPGLLTRNITQCHFRSVPEMSQRGGAGGCMFLNRGRLQR